RRSVLVESKADMRMFCHGERPLVEAAQRLAMGEPISEIRDVRNTAIIVKEALPAWCGVDSTRLDTPGKLDPIPYPYGEHLT
ncbi:YgiQ family radical SAM protein, partial [Escherichia coli]|nr:YgiQ family radical SAM protein [Escherichia coli]